MADAPGSQSAAETQTVAETQPVVENESAATPSLGSRLAAVPTVEAQPVTDAQPTAAPAAATPAAEAAPALSPAAVYEPPKRKGGSRLSTPVWFVLLVLAAVVGAFVGAEYLHTGADFGALSGKTALTEAELDQVVGTYVLDGETHEVTAREAIGQLSSLDALRNADGTYAMPSADAVLAAARTAVLMREVEAQQITVSDEELVAYLKETFGTEDVASLAAAYQMDEETARARLHESASIAKLRKQVVSDTGEAPAAPAAPEEGKEAEPTADYAAYIIGLAGDEWDAAGDRWASDEGPYATALHEFDLRNDAATYEAAMAAYNLAFQLHSAAVTSANTEWTDHVNALLAQAQVAVCTLGT